MSRLAVAMLFLVLAGCGRVADLEPAVGQSLPQKPALGSRPLTANDLLQLPPQANPKRVDELNTKGAPRTADRFDLPPPDGAAVLPPAGAEQPATPDTTGPDNQGEPRQ